MAYGSRDLGRDDTGPEVVELQMRLAGFRGTKPDGDYGPGTELQVMTFQRDVMGQASPSGRADLATLAAIQAFGAAHPVNFNLLTCKCGVCDGFGQGKFKGLYQGQVKVEAYYRYEYPGVHRMILWAFRAAMFHAQAKGWTLTVNSGYRCSVDNQQHARSSTNHHGKAIDIDIVGSPTGKVDMERCDALRGILVEKANAQIAWGAPNLKSLEPSNIAPTWVHYDVRSYDKAYLDDRYFVKSQAALDAPPAGV
ncbi:M15 family metallopeptidase [Phenylobacterium aquaticum]|uniref:M15 family metallopeptidase n=1 Tax=Phenylobacterium aquaticum TaxID=1763816 RepID=UPI0026F2B1DF|nr:M15 family metallopeptidase [Phenylobacterium aquaticum]